LPQKSFENTILRSQITGVPSSVADPGSGIGCLFDPWIRDGRKSASGSGIRDEQPGSYFLELRNYFFAFLGLKYLYSLMRIRDGDSSDPRWKKVVSGINIPDPPHWFLLTLSEPEFGSGNLMATPPHSDMMLWISLPPAPITVLWIFAGMEIS
jgi:hypothetical protein